jgi:hypothetical protein
MAAKNGTAAKYLDEMITESSKRILHAMAAAPEDAQGDWLQAAQCEEQVAYWLEVEGLELEAVIHRYSAASCFAKAERYAEAVTLARSALSFSLKAAHRLEIEVSLKKWLTKAKRRPRKTAKKSASVT